MPWTAGPFGPALLGKAVLPANPVVTQTGPIPIDRAIFVYPWKLILESDGDYLLYNVENDPGETDELSSQYPMIAEQLMSTLENFPRGQNCGNPLAGCC